MQFDIIETSVSDEKFNDKVFEITDTRKCSCVHFDYLKQYVIKFTDVLCDYKTKQPIKDPRLVDIDVNLRNWMLNFDSVESLNLFRNELLNYYQGRYQLYVKIISDIESKNLVIDGYEIPENLLTFRKDSDSVSKLKRNIIKIVPCVTEDVLSENDTTEKESTDGM